MPMRLSLGLLNLWAAIACRSQEERETGVEWMGRSLGGIVGAVCLSSGLRGLRSGKWSEVDKADGEKGCEWDHE